MITTSLTTTSCTKLSLKELIHYMVKRGNAEEIGSVTNSLLDGSDEVSWWIIYTLINLI